MYEYIKGNVEYVGDNLLVIENNDIGYKIYTSNYTIQSLNNSIYVKIYTYLHIREDEMSLYGFITKDELDIFKLLLSVSKIGPKVGINIMSTLKPTEIKSAIINENENLLSKAPGIGNKTAKRMILELKDKIKDNIDEIITDNNENVSNEANEAKSALISLGYNKAEINTALSKIDTTGKNVTDLIKLALKELSN